MEPLTSERIIDAVMRDENIGFCIECGEEHYGVEPDIMVMAKGIADGFPLSCFIAPDKIADSFQVGDHLSTFGGNPVSCAASLANIEYIEREKVPEMAMKKGEIIKGEIKKIRPKGLKIGDIRGSGLMLGLELVSEGESKTPATEEAGKVRAALRERGVLIGVGGAFGNVLRIQPPLVISEEQISTLVESLKIVLEQND